MSGWLPISLPASKISIAYLGCPFATRAEASLEDALALLIRKRLTVTMSLPISTNGLVDV